MIWSKRKFQDADYAPCMERLSQLMLADASRADQYMMVSTEDDAADVDEYYISVPNEVLLRLFDGFERVPESALPKEIDMIHLDAGGVARLFKVKRSCV
jgi:phage terminase large subunit